MPQVLHHRTERHGWLPHYELYPMLGFKRGNHIPKDADFQKTIRIGLELATYWVRPSRGGSKHRVFCFCAPCNQWVPFGRVHQHIKGAKHILCEATILPVQ